VPFNRGALDAGYCFNGCIVCRSLQLICSGEKSADRSMNCHA